MTNDSSGKSYADGSPAKMRASRVLSLGLVSAVSAIAGGVAVAWWYRKTLTKLQNPIGSLEFTKQESGESDHEPARSQGADTFQSDMDV